MSILCTWFKDKALPLLSQPKQVMFNDMEEVRQLAEITGKILIVYQDDVFDVTNYLKDHPGGKEILLLANGKVVDKIFDKYHYPLGDAPKIMKKFKIGSLRPDWFLKQKERVKPV